MSSSSTDHFAHPSFRCTTTTTTKTTTKTDGTTTITVTKKYADCGKATCRTSGSYNGY